METGIKICEAEIRVKGVRLGSERPGAWLSRLGSLSKDLGCDFFCKDFGCHGLNSSLEINILMIIGSV